MSDDPWIYWVAAPAIFGTLVYLACMITAIVLLPIWQAIRIARTWITSR